VKFSIVTISYNQAIFLERTIVSVISQKGVDIEYIVVDPGSTDGSREIIERYRNHFAHVILEKDEGPADGLNKGFSLASGDWFGYINSDDFYLSGGLHVAATAARRHPQAGAIVGNGYIVDRDGQTLRRSISTRYSLVGALYGACFSLQQATFYQASAFRKVNGFNKENRTCWDGEILFELARRNYRIERFYEDVGAFRIHAQSITGSGHLSELYQQQTEAIFRRVTGHDRGVIDRLMTGPIVRCATRLSDPLRSLDLARDRLLPSRYRVIRPLGLT
jgi:glycosyltransferase involved in cell wall biosynthesis